MSTKEVPGAASLRRALSLLTEIRPPLGADLVLESKAFAEIVRNSKGREPPLDLLDDHLKAAIRSLFGEMEAFSYALSQAVVNEPALAATLSKAVRAVLSEQDYDEETDTILPESRHYPLALRLLTASRTFLRCCGGHRTVEFGEAIEAHFRDLTRVRNNFTHPKRFEHLFVVHAFEDFRQMGVWFPGFAADLLRDASRSLGVPMPASVPGPTLAPLAYPIAKPESVFDDDFYSRVLSNPGAAIRYIGAFAEGLQKEMRRAFDHADAAMTPPLDSQRVGYCSRRMVRAVTTYLEGMVGFCMFFLRAVRRSGAQVTCPPGKKGEAPPDRVVRVLVAFSQAFGTGLTPRRNSEWVELKKVFVLRDRLTHPKRATDVLAGTEHLNSSMRALDWILNECMPALTLDLDKISDTYGSRRPAV